MFHLAVQPSQHSSVRPNPEKFIPSQNHALSSPRPGPIWCICTWLTSLAIPNARIMQCMVFSASCVQFAALWRNRLWFLILSYALYWNYRIFASFRVSAPELYWWIARRSPNHPVGIWLYYLCCTTGAGEMLSSLFLLLLIKRTICSLANCIRWE